MRKSFMWVLVTATLMGGSLCLPFADAFSVPFSVQLQPPAAALDLSDLDLRDEQNRRITIPNQVAQMRRLFVSNLTEMLLCNLTPYRKVVTVLLNRSWDPMVGWIKRACQASVSLLVSWFESRSRLFNLSHGSSWRPFDPQEVNLGNSSSFVGDFYGLVFSILSSTVLRC